MNCFSTNYRFGDSLFLSSSCIGYVLATDLSRIMNSHTGARQISSYTEGHRTWYVLSYFGIAGSLAFFHPMAQTEIHNSL